MADYFCRPDASHSGTRNGLSYDTAWGGHAEITSAVQPGDTVYYCGAHAYAAFIRPPVAGSSGQPITFRGDYVLSPGSITFTDSGTISNDKSWVDFENLSINGAAGYSILANASSVSHVHARGVRFTGGAVGISWSGSNGSNVSDVGAQDCIFQGQTSAAVQWFVFVTNAISTLTDARLVGNTFRDQTSGNIIHLRAESDANVAAVMDQIEIAQNEFIDCNGQMIRVLHDRSELGQGGSIVVNGNHFTRCGINGSVGGAVFISGFSSSSIYGNRARDVSGPQGGLDARWCENLFAYDNDFQGIYHSVAGGFNIFDSTNVAIYSNRVDDVTTDTIDGNGILIDDGCSNVSVYRNRLSRCAGLPGVFNSGYAIMLLASTNVTVEANVGIDCRNGVHIGNAGPGQSGTIKSNTFAGIVDYAIYAHSAASLGNWTAKNNVFSGTGYKVYDATAIAWTGEDYNDFYGFASGTYQHSLGANDLAVDPQFNSAYEPQNVSLRGAAPSLGGLDFYGRPYRSPASIGAAEHYERAGAPAALPAIGLLLGTYTAAIEETATVAWGPAGGVPHAVTFQGEFINLVSDFDEDTIGPSSSVEESITVGDAVSAAVAYAGTYAESVTVSVTEQGLPLYPAAYTESISASFAEIGDTTGSSGGAAPLPSIGLLLELHLVLADFADSATLSDAYSATAEAAGVYGDSIAVDTSSAAGNVTASDYADSITVSDATGAGIDSPTVAFADSITVSHSQDAVYAIPTSVAESATLSDAVDAEILGPSVYAESATLDDAFSRTAVEAAQFAEPATAAEETSAGMVTARAFAETIAVGDASDLVDIFVSDAYAASFSIGAAVSETATPGDEFDAVPGAYMIEVVELSDATSVATDYAVGYADSASASQALTGNVSTDAVFADSATLDDAYASATIAAGSFADEVVTSESTDAFYTQPSALAETATLAEEFDSIRAHNAAMGSPISVSDAMSGGFDVGADLVEPISLSESFALAVVSPGVFDEPVTIVHDYFARWTGTLAVAESATAQEDFACVFGELTGVLWPMYLLDIYAAGIGSVVGVAESVQLGDDFGCSIVTNVTIHETGIVEFDVVPGFLIASTFIEGVNATDRVGSRDISHGPVITVYGDDRTITVDGTDRTIVVEDIP